MKQIRFDRRLAIVLMALLIAGYAAFIGWKYQEGFEKAARGETPLFTDFTSTYGAGLLLRHQAAEYLYHRRSMVLATQAAADAAYGGDLSEAQKQGVGFAPWMYPPTFIALVLPLGYLSYFAALAAWLGLTAIPYLMAVRAILERERTALWIALAAPPVFYNAMFGQTGFLTAGLIGLGLFHLQGRPWLAGILIGLASVKPHLGLLLPFVFLTGGHWRAFLAAFATVAAMIAASLLAFGDEPWFAFIGTTLFHMEGFQHGAYAWNIMASILSVARLSGLSLEAAWQVQAWATVIVIVLLSAVWWLGRRRPDTFNLQAAALCSAIPLAVPAIYLYDLVVLAVGLAWLLRDMKLQGWRPWEAAVLGLAMVGLLLVKPLGTFPGVQMGMLSIAALLALALLRFQRRTAGKEPVQR